MSKERVLVIAAHPDDEVLGCGGSIARHVADGDEVQVAIMAQGLFSRGTPEEAEQQALRDACAEANRILGVQGLECFDLPDNRLDGLDLLDLVKPVEALVARHRPGIVYAHWSGDVNIDHRRLHEAVVTACRPQPGHPVHTLLFFEIPSSTEWQVPHSAPAFWPGWFNDIGSTLDTKLRALDAYAMEMREWPHPRSLKAVEHLARWRGACVGMEAAEAFVLGRHLNRH
ncbi:PIG-L family deacetylase [Pseudomonas sp. No.21]|jgi:LmbE family N-acetylglucosaminyl deacetylase|uniref:PIG-L deacetylase family protein n=1 Tax=Pseudomonas TaxID=286 RepID=UPI000DA7075B|nr:MULTISPECIES: PIG-L deacetylase family protein [Pseudomonas]MDW3712014.1 PIG-L deacetylase family protein [Pseudomonas sp. 2023EL-01195]PZE13658.1 PIG-L family deacetylase [Pseudomonas sp. 57B-090624]BBP84274.1 PIG-L domain-containing protein [Pseudomonas sp. Pc102]GJN48378.1 PIG-L domain-containing protein [Pseudomonas tohonis]